MQIYITDLAAYNQGSLEGYWLDIDLLNEDEIKEEINNFLASQTEKHGELREEYFITDYDDIPSEFGEYPNISSLVEYVEQVNTHGKEIVDAAHYLGVEPDSYYGTYESTEEFGRELAESMCLFEKDKSGTLERYFDFESYGSDEAINGYSEHNGIYFYL